MWLYPSPVSAVLDLEDRPYGRATSVSCSLRWQGRWHIPRQGAQCHSHEINMNSVALPHEWRERRVVPSSPHAVNKDSWLQGEYDPVRFHIICFSVCVCVPWHEETSSTVCFWSGTLSGAHSSCRRGFSYIQSSVSFILCSQSITLLSCAACCRVKTLIKVLIFVFVIQVFSLWKFAKFLSYRSTLD